MSDTLIHDLRRAARTWSKSPLFAFAAIVTIALGIGMSTAMFSVANAVLLKPLPYDDPDQLVLASGEFTRRSVKHWPFSNANFLDLRNGAKSSFEDLASVLTFRSIVRKEDGTPEQVRTAVVTPNFFRLFRAKIRSGRDFSDADGQPQTGTSANTRPGGPVSTVAILSYEYWQRRYGGNPAIVGYKTANGMQIVGVLAPGFELLLPAAFDVERVPEFWVAGRLNYNGNERSNVSLRVIGRLRDGATVERAHAEAAEIASQIRSVDQNHQTAGFQIQIEPMHKYLVAEVRPILLALMGAVGILLLISCANVGSLLLVRQSLRERELAVRSALGGSRWRLMRQTLTEAVLLSATGSLLGLFLAWFAIGQLTAMAPANLPRVETIGIDTTVLAFTALMALLAAAVFGFAPALRASRPDVSNMLRAAGGTAALGHSRILRDFVVVAEVALSFVLLVGSGLMIRSFMALQRVDPGYDPTGVLTFLVVNSENGATPEKRAASIRIIQDRLKGMPGVESVTASNRLPLADAFHTMRWGTEEARTDRTKFRAAEPQFVLPGYFETLRTRLIEGRTFINADNSPNRNAVIIDQVLAARAFPKESAVGKRLLIRIRTADPEEVEVIGVVAHQRTTSLAEVGREQIYFTDGFSGHGQVSRWAVRTAGHPARLATAIRSEVLGSYPHLIVTEMQTMEALVERGQAKTRFSLLLLTIFATVAVVLASVGLYGVLSTAVRQRTTEIGVRVALGAAPFSVFTLVVSRGLVLSGAGLVLGFFFASGLTRVMASMLVETKPTDSAIFVVTAALLLAIATAASWIPARRAAALDPVTALRQD